MRVAVHAYAKKTRKRRALIAHESNWRHPAVGTHGDQRIGACWSQLAQHARSRSNIMRGQEVSLPAVCRWRLKAGRKPKHVNQNVWLDRAHYAADWQLVAGRAARRH